MARTCRIKKTTDACYHVISRIAGKRYLLASPSLKREMIETLARVAEFSGVCVFSYCIMDNHFHVVCKVIQEAMISEAEIIRRIEVLKGKKVANDVAEHIAELRKLGKEAAVEAELNRWRRRMDDLSEFVKTFKETFDRAYRKLHPYNGSFWDGRFRSTCIENGEYLRRVVKYVNYNPVRAGIVSQCVRYEWCTIGDSSEFAAKCRQSIEIEFCVRIWGQTPEGADGNWGLSPSETQAIGEADWLLKRMPQFGSGKLFGSRAFVLGGIDEAGWSGCRKPRPRMVTGGGFSSHGHKLAALVDQAA